MPLTHSEKIISAGNLNRAIPTAVFNDFIGLAARELQELFPEDYPALNVILKHPKSGEWDARRNIPFLKNGKGKKDSFYQVKVPGTQYFGNPARPQRFQVSDYVFYNGEHWRKVEAHQPADLQNGETHLALAYAILPLNSRSSVDGGFLSATGFQDSRSELLSIAAVNQLAREYRTRAYSILDRYLTGSSEAVPEKSDAIVAAGSGWYRI